MNNMHGLCKIKVKVGLFCCPPHKSTFLYVAGTLRPTLEINVPTFVPEYSVYIQGYLITMSEIGIFWQFQLGKFGVQFESKIFYLCH